MTEKRPVAAFYGKVRIPTIGHKKAIDTAKNLAKRVGGQLRIGLSGTSRPLTPETKKAHAEMMFNHPVQTGDEHSKNLFSYLSHLNQDHDELHLVAGSDRAPEYRRTLQDWNGRADKSGRVGFNFKKWKVHEVEGERGDVDKHPTQMSQGELERSVSATKLEGLAKSGDYEGFKAYHPGFPEKHVQKVYNQVRMSSSEPSTPKTIKQIKSKKVVKEELHNHGEMNHEKFGPMLDTFVQFASKHLGIKSMPSMKLEKEPMSSSFGGYNPAEKSIVVITKNRHPMDIYRTVAHELVHHKQNEDGRLGKDIRKEGATGSPIENEANSEAGKVMRWFAKSNPEMFKSGYVTESYLDEGINDPSMGKAIFMGGGPGSGKDFVGDRAGLLAKGKKSGLGLTEINSDNALEHLMRIRGLDPMMPKEEDYERNIARGDAKKLTKEKERLALAGRRGVVINGTADDPEKIAAIKKHLEDLGYETKMLFVNTSDDVSRQRNYERGLAGGRKVPDGTDKNGRPDGSADIRQEKWQAAQEAKESLKKLFGNDHFIHVDNSEDYRTVDDKRKKEIDKSHNQLFKHYRQFTSAPAQTEKSKEWIEGEKKKRGITQYKPARATTVSQKKPVAPYVPNASELEQAKRLGIQHVGGGQFGSKAGATHVSRNGQLTMMEEKYKKIKSCWKGYQAIGFKKKNGKRVPNCVPVDEEFETFMKENTPSDREWGKTSLTKIYADATPGQTFPVNPLFEKIKEKKLKRIATEDNNIPPGSLPVQDGLGPEFTRRTSPSYIGFAGIQESVEKWANSETTVNRFIEKYGNEAQEKLFEAAQRLNELEFSNIGPKFFTHLREAWEAKGGRDMGTVPNTGKEEMAEQSFNRAFANARSSGQGKFTWRGKSYTSLKKGETELPSRPKDTNTPKKDVVKSDDRPQPAMTRGPKTPEMVAKPDERNRMSRDDQQSADVAKVKSATDSAAASIVRKADPVVQRMKKDMPDAYDAITKPKKDSNIFTGSRHGDQGIDEDWQKANRKDKTDGLSQKAVNAYRRENPGSKLQTAVTEKKPTGKRAKRRLSFCRRMGGMKKRLTSAETARDPDSRINKALRRWNCEE